MTDAVYDRSPRGTTAEMSIFPDVLIITPNSAIASIHAQMLTDRQFFYGSWTEYG
jgi:hypothetical protein